MRSDKLIWFLAGAVCMALYLQGPHEIGREAYLLGERVSLWVDSL